MSICKIFITFLLGIAIYYIRSCILLANKQKNAALRLECYLDSITDELSDYGLASVYLLGKEWHKKEVAIVNNSSYSRDKQIELLEILKHETKSEIFEAVSKQTPEELKETFKGLSKRLESIPNEMRLHYLNELSTIKQNMIDGKTYLSDEEAVLLGSKFASDIIIIKTDSANYMDHAIEMCYSFFNSDKQPATDVDFHSVQNILWKMTCACKKIAFLRQYVKPAFDKSIYALAMDNIKSFYFAN